jgi:drug/metabolite transporter (DMT)-like permease
MWSLAANSFTIPTNINYAALLAYSSIGALAIGNVIYLFLLQHEEATTLSGSTLIIPTVALLLGWLLLGENLNRESLFGALLTLGGIYLVNVKRKAKGGSYFATLKEKARPTQ